MGLENVPTFTVNVWRYIYHIHWKHISLVSPFVRMVFDTEKILRPTMVMLPQSIGLRCFIAKKVRRGKPATETCHRKPATGNVAQTCLAPWEAVSFDLASVEEGTSSRVTGIELSVWVGSEGRVLFFWADF